MGRERKLSALFVHHAYKFGYQILTILQHIVALLRKIWMIYLNQRMDVSKWQT